MIFRYLQNIGFEVGSQIIRWGEHRQQVRDKLPLKFTQDNGLLDNSQFFGGDTSYNIIYRRDIYDDFKTNFNEADLLTEWEFHGKHIIEISGTNLTFGKDTSDIVDALKQIDARLIEIESGKYLFENLKFLVATSEAMGGDGNGLAYFYAAADISHLLE